MTTTSFATDRDLAFLGERGISAEEASRQWKLLRNVPAKVRILRPCTIGDGIKRIDSDDHADYLARHRQSAAKGRWSKFVPASGAASRMFSISSPDDRQRLCQDVVRFAFVDDLERVLAGRGTSTSELARNSQSDALMSALLDSDGLGYASCPKGLVKFHRYQKTSRTPFEEHLAEARACLAAADESVRAHFTVASDHRARFEGLCDRFRNEAGIACHVDFSIQKPSTDTLAMDDDGQLMRDEQGMPVLRPGGHGALIANMQDLAGDLVFVKNIDNVGHKRTQAASALWIQLLGGYLCTLQDAIHAHLDALQSAADSTAVSAARDFLVETFPGKQFPDRLPGSAGRDDLSLRSDVIGRLDRPLRICGMVQNDGEPGGGPFWVSTPDGSESPQIVESVEVDANDLAQQAIVQTATHFNPVFMTVALRNHRAQPHTLSEYVDPNRVILTAKQVGGKGVRVLERPGLWNGAMAKWNTVFVEVPKDVFSPVKTVLDLLRPEHQG